MPSPAPVQAQAGWLQAIDAPPKWRCIDLLSDLHLSADTPLTAQAFIHHLQHTPADAVLLLGDIFEAWVGDDLIDLEPEGFEANLLRTLRDVSRQRWIGFMPGNRDFLLGDHALHTAGLHGLQDPCVVRAWDQHVLLAHGDAWCTDDHDYLKVRAQVRTPLWQSTLLSRPLAERQALARQLRGASEQRKSEQGFEGYGDLDDTLVQNALQQHGCNILVHGHTHRPADHALTDGKLRRVLSDWDLDTSPTAARAEILRWTPDGLTRMGVGGHEPPLR